MAKAKKRYVVEKVDVDGYTRRVKKLPENVRNKKRIVKNSSTRASAQKSRRRDSKGRFVKR